MTLTKAELTTRLVDGIGLTTGESRDLVDAFFSEIATTLSQGEEVKLAGFGAFDVRDKVARPGRNPKTGQTVLVTARRVVGFRSSNKLKARVEASLVRVLPERRVA